MNHKKMYRLYHEEKLMVRRRGGRKRALGTRAPMLLPERLNQRWSLDFIADTLSDGRRFRILCVVDDFSRECLACVVDTSLSGVRVAAPRSQELLRGREGGAFLRAYLLRVPERVEDFIELGQAPVLLAKRTGPFTVLANLIRSVPVYEVQRRHERNAHLDLALASLSRVGQALGKLKCGLEAGGRLAGSGAFLGSGGRYNEVGDGVLGVASALEVHRESKCISGPVLVRILKDSGDPQMQAPPPVLLGSRRR
jgi:hypothetical protein